MRPPAVFTAAAATPTSATDRSGIQRDGCAAAPGLGAGIWITPATGTPRSRAMAYAPRSSKVQPSTAS